MKNLTVKIAENSGFCFGVDYAIQIAETYLETNDYLYCLGEIIHNDEEVKRLAGIGLRIIDFDIFNTLRNETVLIRAHGEHPDVYKVAFDQDISLLDATCPVILKLQNRIRGSVGENRKILIFGNESHPEVKGLMGHSGSNSIILKEMEGIENLDPSEKLIVYSQSTSNLDKYYKMKDLLFDSGFDFKFNDTICRQVSHRGQEVKDFGSKFDVILFVSGTKSSNGRALFEQCKEVNPRTYFVSSINDVDFNWFGSNESIGVFGATSTPMWLMEEIKASVLAC